VIDEHERLRDGLAAYALGALDGDDQVRIAAHLRECAACTRLLAEYEDAAGLIPFALPVQEPPGESRAAIITRIRQNDPRPASSALNHPVQRRPVLDLRRLRPYGWAAIAAAFVLLLLWNVNLARDRANRGDLAATLAGTPEERVAAMVSTTAAPGASGRLYLEENGRSAILAVTGLPTLQEDHVYQFWFATTDSSRRDSAGTFRVNDKGQALVSLDVPGPLAQYQEIWITQEPENGSGVPTAPHFLEGPL
jgi:anti-sigma-K factor RskA